MINGSYFLSKEFKNKLLYLMIKKFNVCISVRINHEPMVAKILPKAP
jgi:hypothetical protein